MAFRAMFRGKQTFPAAGIAEFLEEARRVEVGEQIRGGLLIEIARD